MQQSKRFLLYSVGSIIFSLVITGCGFSQHYQTLQQDFTAHQTVSYLTASSSTSQLFIPELALDEGFATADQAQKEDLLARKEKYRKILEQTLRQNALFPVEQALWGKLKTLDSKAAIEKYLGQSFDLDTVLTLVLLHNPEIQKAYYQAKASLEQYNQVNQLDDLLKQYSVFTENSNLRTSSMKLAETQHVAFPFPDKLALKGNIVDQSVQQALLRFDKTIQDVMSKTKIAYDEWQYFNKASAIVKENVNLLQRLNQVSQHVYNTPKGNLNTVLNISIDQAQSQNTLDELQGNAEVRLVRLNQLLNISYDFKPKQKNSSNATGQSNLRLTKESSLKIGVAQRIEVRLLEPELKKLALLIELSETMVYADFSQDYTMMLSKPRTQLASEPTQNKPKAKTSFSLNEAYLQELKRKYQALQQKVQQTKNDTTDAISTAYFNVEDSVRKQKLYREVLIPRAKTNFQINQSLYETGQRAYAEMISAHARYLQYRLSLAKIQRDQAIALSRLERLVGQRIRTHEKGQSQGRSVK